MKLPRASLATLGFALIWTFLIVFVFYPLTRIFYDAFTNEAGQFTLVNFFEFFTDPFYLRSLWKSLALGVAAVITTSVVGIAVAFLLIRYDFPYRNLFSYLTMLPMILPPLVGVLGFVFILGRAGTVNVLLHDWFGLEHPINFVYGVHGVLLVETVHLFPMMTLSILDALARVDPSLEEAAQGMGAKGWRRFWDVTLPLTTPGYISGALLVFIWTFADFVTPLVLGVQDLLAPQAYLNIVQFVDRRIFRMGIVISALLVMLAIVFVLAARQYVAIKDYSSLAYSKVERRRLGPVARWLAVGFLSLLLFVSFAPQVGVLLAAVGRGWSLTPFPVQYTLEFFEQVSVETPKFIVNSLLFCGIAVALCLLIGVPMAWIMGRTQAPWAGRDGRAHHADACHPGDRSRHRVRSGVQLPAAVHRSPAHRDVDHPAARACRTPAALHGARQLFLAPARAQVHGGGGRERRRDEAPHLPGHHGAARLEGHLRRGALLLHHLDPGGLVDDLPHPRRLGDDAVRHLHLLHRRLAEPGGGARRDPDRSVRSEPLRGEPDRRDAGRRAVRLTRLPGNARCRP